MGNYFHKNDLALTLRILFNKVNKAGLGEIFILMLLIFMKLCS